MKNFINVMKSLGEGIYTAAGILMILGVSFWLADFWWREIGQGIIGYALWVLFGILAIGAVRVSMDAVNSFKLVVLRQRKDISCTWCGGRSLKFKSGEDGEWIWEYRNSDGSPDKRVRNNFRRAGYLSTWECKHCEAISFCQHYMTRAPSKAVGVWKGELIYPGSGERIAEDYEVETGYFVNKNIANRKGR